VLVRITDKKGKDQFVNPLYIKMIKAKNERITEVWGSFSSMNPRIQTEEDVESLSDRVSVALTSIGGAGIAGVVSEQESQQAAASGSAGAAAASG